MSWKHKADSSCLRPPGSPSLHSCPLVVHSPSHMRGQVTYREVSIRQGRALVHCHPYSSGCKAESQVHQKPTGLQSAERPPTSPSHPPALRELSCPRWRTNVPYKSHSLEPQHNESLTLLKKSSIVCSKLMSAFFF